MSAFLAVVLAGGEAKKSGPIGLAVILVLCVACYFLFKSMSKHLRKVREEFPTDGSEPVPTPTPTPGVDSTSGSAEPSTTTDEPPPA